MDTQDSAFKAELDRRLNVILTEERNDLSHQPLSKKDLWVAVVVVAVFSIIGLVVLI
jgi:hypothetical protein